MSDADKAARDLVAQFIEEHSADAVVLAFSSVNKNKTTTHIVSWGNIHACRGLAEELYGVIVEPPEEEEYEDVDE
tara:strand:- start:600 stop:824 length:225 start_codon:yes stop_codon:yes gene_type:complete